MLDQAVIHVLSTASLPPWSHDEALGRHNLHVNPVVFGVPASACICRPAVVNRPYSIKALGRRFAQLP